METIIAWFDAYRIDHKVSYNNGIPAFVSPLGKLEVTKTGAHWRVNGKIVSRKFIAALKRYYGA